MDNKENNDIAVMQEVLRAEANSMLNMADKLDNECEKVVDLIMGLKGRLIISGMGKSGHIGNKMAATLASLGTPSFFVHPGEASHGDLGMITADDAVIAISNSGESKELGDLIAYTKRWSIPLISISKNAESTLGEASDYHLNLNYDKEICPMGLAPTTSTTLTLALGDALALALLTRRGFGKDDYGNFHPGGKLGSAVLRNEKVMHDNYDLPLVALGSQMTNAIEVMSEKALGCVGVIDENDKFVGMITDGDIRRHITDIMSKTVNDVMTINPTTTTREMLAGEGLAIMNDKEITSLFVLDDNGKTIGIIHMHDYLKKGVM